MNTKERSNTIIASVDIQLEEKSINAGTAKAAASMKHTLGALRAINKSISSVVGDVRACRESVDSALRGANTQLATIRQAQDFIIRLVDGKPLEWARNMPIEQTDVFIDKLADAILNRSIRKWARRHVELMKECADQKRAAERKLKKLEKRTSEQSAEGDTARNLHANMTRARDAAQHRMDLALRKFLELRRDVLQTLIGASEMMYTAIGGDADAELIAAHSTNQESESLAHADKQAIYKSNRRRNKK